MTAEPNRGRRPASREVRDLQNEIGAIRKSMSDDRDAAAAQLVVVGSSLVFPDPMTPPTGWLYCDGTAVSRSTYSVLFEIVEETHGAGDGATTFALPDFTATDPALGQWYIWTGVES